MDTITLHNPRTGEKAIIRTTVELDGAYFVRLYLPPRIARGIAEYPLRTHSAPRARSHRRKIAMKVLGWPGWILPSSVTV